MTPATAQRDSHGPIVPVPAPEPGAAVADGKDPNEVRIGDLMTILPAVINPAAYHRHGPESGWSDTGHKRAGATTISLTLGQIRPRDRHRTMMVRPRPVGHPEQR